MKETWKIGMIGLGIMSTGITNNFIKTGNPNGPGLPEWPECDGTSETVQTLDVGLARVAVKHSSSKRRREYVINPKR